MPTAMIALSPDLERLIDERLDAVDRILSLSRTARSERMQILDDLGSQIRDRLAAKNTEEPTRADLLAVFAELDPPEAYLDEEVSVSPTFRASQFANEGNQRVAGDALAAGIPTSHEKKLLAIWAGILTSVGCILAPSSWAILLATQSESFAITFSVLLQLLLLAGSVLAIVNFLQSGKKSDLNRLISGACLATIPWPIITGVAVIGLMLGSGNEYIGIINFYLFPACAVTHGIWIAFFTIRYMLKRQKA